MYCKKCGAEITAGASFCPQCGEKQPMPAKEPGKKKSALSCGMKAGIVAAGVVVLAVIAAAVIFFVGGKGHAGDVPEEQTANAGKEVLKETGEPPEEELPEEELSEEPLYHIDDVAIINTSAVNYTPGTKEAGMKWDSSLFYWLEDVDTASSEDGNIARCRLTKTLLRDAQSGALIQYEIYSDPDTGNIYKIVSVEEAGGWLKLTDWYYLNGQPNFVFQREDSVYTPTYATINKVGERYYFDHDVMVKWRMIRTPGEVGEYTLTPGDTWYSQGDYYAESEELRQIYDATELRMFNAARNTYDAIAAGGNIGMVQGYLQDTVGNGIAGKTVKVYRVSDNALLYETATDDSGRYVFFVYLDDTECYVKLEADDRYKEMTVQGVRFAPSSVTYTYGLTMHKNSGDEYPVTLHLYSCMDVVSDDNGTTTGGVLQTVTATIREGAGNYSGESLRTVETQNGELAVNLPSGVYTVQFHTEGYLDGYKEVEVMEAATVVDAYAMPGVAETQTGVILTWDSDEVDLDLTLFTPYQAAGGDMAHIGGSVYWDGNGNMLIADNKSKCEVIFVNSGVQGSFKLYVNNYTDSIAGNYGSDALSRMNVHVYIYNSNGFVTEYTMPLGQNGVVWEVAEINGGTVTSAQRVYSEITGKSWWTGSKEKEPVIYTCITERETFSEKTRSYKEHEYNEYGELSLLHEIYSVSDGLGRNAEGAAIYGESMERENATYEYTYDTYGNMKESVYSGATGTSRTEWDYTYIDGHMTEAYEYDYGSGGFNGVAITKYDEKERVISKQRGAYSDYWFYNKSEEDITEFINTNLFDPNLFTGEEEKWGTLYICDENGAVLREERYEGSVYVNVRTVTNQYSYDAIGNCVALRIFEHDGAFDYTETYSYNSLGKLESVHCECGNSFHADSNTLYYYDAKGNLIKTVTTEYYDDYESMEFSGIEALYYDGSRWIVALEQTEYTYY